MKNKHNKDGGFYALLALIVLIVGLFLSSCMTNRKGELTEKGKNFIALHCKGKDSVRVSDNTTILFDTVKIPFPVKGETVYLQSPCDSLGNLKPVNITTKKNGIKTSVKSIGGVLAVDCDTDSLTVIIETQKRVINEFKGSQVVVDKPCNKEHIKGWHYFLMWTGGLYLTYGLIKWIYKAVKAYLSGGVSAVKFW